jgi:hypothetical protein
MSDVVLSAQEVQQLAGGYRRARDQLRELHRQGFHRARIGHVSGEVILERAHYDAVCSGRLAPAPGQPQGSRPKLRAVT